MYNTLTINNATRFKCTDIGALFKVEKAKFLPCKY